MRLKRYKTIIISLILLSTLFYSCLPVQAQEEEEWSAEVNAYIIGEIPSIKVTEWTPINITLNDAFGIDWEYLSSSLFPYASKFLGPQINVLYMNIVWSISPLMPSYVQDFLGYTKIRLEPEIVEGNPKGWYLKVTPNFIPEANPGRNYSITLEARVDDSAINYSIIAGIKCTRIDTNGGEIGTSYIYVPIKASPTNYIKMNAIATRKNAGPKSMVYFTFDITNEGYYRDVFQFDLEEENGLLALTNEQAVALNPGETRAITMGVLTPEKFWDPGTPNKIDVNIYSIGDPTKTLVGSLVVYTEGFYISPLVLIILTPIIIILGIIYLLYFYRREKKEKEILGKPEKPWNIPEEKQHLEELKQKNKEEYEKERQMMEDEYKSAMLWYKNYREAERQRGKSEISESKQGGISGRIFKKKEKQEKTDKEKTIDKKKQKKENKITQFLNKPNKKKKEKKLTQTISLTKKQKPKKKVKTKKVEKNKEVDKIQVQKAQRKSEEQRRKERLLLQIKRDQDKQKKMIK
jgi:hypothetical protein